MNCTLSKALIFTVGAAIGSAVTYKLVKDKFAQIAQEEIDSMKEFYSRHHKYEGPEQSEECLDYYDTEKTKEEYESLIEKSGYDASLSTGELKGVSSVDEPYVISPEEFGDNDYEVVSLTYYDDGVLADEMDEVIEDVEDIVGLDSLNHFGEYEDDSVFVRNDRLERDYEILKDTRKYSSVKKLYQR